MKALVLDGGHEGDSLTSVAVLGMTSALAGRGISVELVKPRELAIAPCEGCFGCWNRTPGECVIKDDAHDVVGSYVGSDLVAYVTPVTFGGYSSQLKKLLDRILLSVLDPRFTVVGGEVHHLLRYRRHPKTVGFGTLPSPDPEAERLFARLVARNGLNVHQDPVVEILAGVADPDSARSVAERLLDRAGVTA
ncbi:MAG TPA: flavodoxin family protein [Candidatus Deferrimicrobium sp.]